MRWISDEDARFARDFVDEAVEEYAHVMSERMLEVMRTKMLTMLLTTPSGLVLLEELRQLDREEERLS
jgi:hypothetical protein